MGQTTIFGFPESFYDCPLPMFCVGLFQKIGVGFGAPWLHFLWSGWFHFRFSFGILFGTFTTLARFRLARLLSALDGGVSSVGG